MNIKKEIIDDFNDNTSGKPFIYNRFESYYPLNDYNSDEKLEPPKKVMKTRVDKILELMNCEKSDDLKICDHKIGKNEVSKPDYDKRSILNNGLTINTSIHWQKSTQMMNISYDSFLQELFSWNPEWFDSNII